jgi:hypothetical protein
MKVVSGTALGRWLARLATLALMACGTEPSETPSAQPLPEFPFATASPDCAPWDGPAVAILLTATADTVPPVAAPYLHVGLYDTRDRLLRRTTRWPAETDVGGASWCVDGDDCMAADSGIVRLEALEGDTVLPGRLRLVFPGGAVLDGSFRATWRPRLAMCG